MEKTLDELRAEADVLGIEYPKTMGAAKLAQKIEEHYRAGELADAVQTIDEALEEVAEVSEMKNGGSKKPAGDPWKEHVAKRKAEALKKYVVTITSNDKRDNDVVTSEYISVENQFFAIGRIVPLDIPVELEHCLIEQAKATMIPMAVDEIVGGQRTGNKVTKMIKKFSVSYENGKPTE